MDAEWKEHLSRCEKCAVEARELKAILDAVMRVGAADPDDGYWSAFPSRLQVRIRKDEKDRAKKTRWLWVAAAVAALAIGSWGTRELVRSTPTAHEPWGELLPPIDEDQEFQILLSIVELVPNREESMEMLLGHLSPALDPVELDAQEQARFLKELQRDLEEGNHEKS